MEILSFNCSVLDDTFEILDNFSINILRENGELFAELGDKIYSFKIFKVDRLKDYICKRGDVVDSNKHTVELFKVDIDDENRVTKEILIDKTKPRLLFKDYFQDELNGKAEFTVTNIHIISIIPATAG